MKRDNGFDYLNSRFLNKLYQIVDMILKTVGEFTVKIRSDKQVGLYVRELARQNIGRFAKTVKLLRFNNRIIHTSDIDSFFK